MYTILMSNGTPIVFTGSISSVNSRGHSGSTIYVKVECWPDKFKVAVWSRAHRNEREWTPDNWTSVAEQINHRYCTTLPLEYPTSENISNLDSFLPEGEASFGSTSTLRKREQPPARRRSSRIIED
jgi:hypothetical protein